MTTKNHPFDLSKFKGFSAPTTTQTPDEFFDFIMQDLNESELKVILYIIRRTFGFKKQTDNISLNQMVNGITTKNGRTLDRGTGLGKSTVKRALISLKGKNLIEAERNTDPKRGNLPTTYKLKFEHNPKPASDPPLGPSVGLPLGPSVGHTTNSNTTNSNTTTVVVKLIDKKFSKKQAQQLVDKFGAELITQKIEYLDYLLETDPDQVTKPKGWLYKAITENYGAPDGFMNKSERQALETERQQKAEDAKNAIASQMAERERKREERRQMHDQQKNDLRDKLRPPETLTNFWSDTINYLTTVNSKNKLCLVGSELMSTDDNHAIIWVDQPHYEGLIKSSYIIGILRRLSNHLDTDINQLSYEFVYPNGEIPYH